MFSNIVASVGVKYIIESHLSADRWSLTNKIFPELDEVFHCTRYGIRKLEIREVDNIFQQSKNDIYVLCPVYEFLFKRAVVVRPKFSRRSNLPECRMWPNVECSEVPKCGLNIRSVDWTHDMIIVKWHLLIWHKGKLCALTNGPPAQSTRMGHWLSTLFHPNCSAAQVYVLHPWQFIFALNCRRRWVLQLFLSSES